MAFKVLAITAALACVALSAAAQSARPAIKKLGTIDCDMVETNPVVFNGRLYRFEYVRATRYTPNTTGDSYFRFIDVASGTPTPAFAKGYHLGSAYVHGDTMYAYGVEAWGGQHINVFWSKDLETWESKVALELPGWKIYNNSVCSDASRHVMAFEIGAPPEETGAAFTMRFATSDDLIAWTLTPSECVYTKERYSACGDIHYLDGYYYMIYLEALPGCWEPYIVRSKNLIDWESSPCNPVIQHSDEDRRIANDALTQEQRKRIETAKNANNSDVGLCEFEGRTVIYYSWGDQHGTEHLAEAVYEGSVKALLEGFFPAPFEVTRELYKQHTDPGVSVWVNAHYVGPGLDRVEVHSCMAKSDTPEKPVIRRSKDNGRTWSAFEPKPEVVTHDRGARIYWDGGAPFYDPATGLSVAIWLRQTHVDGRYHNQCFVRTSKDHGRTWLDEKVPGPPALKQLVYEDGAPLDPDNPLDADFLCKNEGYIGNNIIRHSNGTLIHCLAAVNVPYENPTGKSYNAWTPADAKNIGSGCFIGAWKADTGDYDWTAGQPVWVPLEVSSRGLMEPEVAELVDGRVLVIWRTSSTPVTPGRKFFSISEDGGRTLSPPAELKYDDGTAFYSPSSFHRMIRSSVTKKLYWIGNICDRPPSGNSPRYPLIIAEVDEKSPSLVRSTVTCIDERGADDSDKLQLSNFSLFENRETHDFELHLTRLGADANDFWGADAYKYTIRVRR